MATTTPGRMEADLFLEEPAAPQRSWASALRALWRRLRPLRWLGSLQLRLALGGLLVLIAAMAAITALMARHTEEGLVEAQRLHALADAQQTAAGIGRALDQMFAATERAAAPLTHTSFDNPQALAAELARSLLPASPLANVFVSWRGSSDWVFADRAGARRLQAQAAELGLARRLYEQRQTLLSAPFQSRISGEPVVLLVHPVVREGVVIGLVGGSLRLASRDLLGDLHAGDGAADGVRITDRNGLMLAHPEHARLLNAIDDDPVFGGAWRTWRHTQQAQPSAAWSEQAQLRAVAAIPGHPWLVWTASAHDALVAPVAQARREVLPEAVLIALAATLALAAFLRWQLRPLHRLERHARALLAGDAGGDWPRADGEVGRLARTLHHLWAERTQMESFNAQVLQKLGSVMASAPVGLAFTRNQRFELVSDELCHLLGRPEHEIVGQRTQMIFASNADHAALGPEVAGAFARGQSYCGEWQLLHADGSRLWGLLRARPVAAAQPEAGTIWSINDVSDQVAARRQLEHAAHHDALTGVVNRQGFEQALQSLFEAQPGSRPASLVMIDLDHFKPINDSAGHAAGDAMLVAVAQAIASRVRSTDLVVRLGGDEFALLLPHCPHERALEVAEKVREAITDLALTWEAHTLRVGASIGVAELGEQYATAAQWIAQADAACYEAKRQGRGRVRSARAGLRLMQG